MTEYFRLWSNGFEALLDMVVLSAMGMYIWQHLRTDWRAPHLNFAIAVTVYLSGHTITRIWIWLWEYLKIHGHEVDWMRQTLPVLGVGDVFTAIGLICLVRVIGEPSMGAMAWMWFVTIAMFLSCAALL